MIPVVVELGIILRTNTLTYVPELINIRKQVEQSVPVVQRLNGFGGVQIKNVLPVMI